MKRSITGDGHKMSVIEVKNELAKTEKSLYDSHKGYRCSCGRCGEVFLMSSATYELNDKIDIEQHLVEGNCPTCQGRFSDEWYRFRNFLLEVRFTVEGRDFLTLRVPVGYKHKKIIKLDHKGRAVLK